MMSEGLNVGIDDLFSEINTLGGKKEGATNLSQSRGGVQKEEDLEETPEIKDEDAEDEVDDTKSKDKSEENKEEDDDSVSAEDNQEDAEEAETDETKESPYKLIATLLKEKNAIDELPEDIEEDDDYIANLVNDTTRKRVQSAINEYKETLPDEIKYLLENYEEGVPLMSLIEREKTVAEYSAIDKKSLKDNESLKKEIVVDYLVKTGTSEVKAKAKVDKYEASGILDEESEEALDRLIEIEKQETQAFIQSQKLQRQAALKQEQERVKAIEVDINNKKEAIPGFEWTKEDKKRIFKAMTEVAGKTKDGRPVNKINKYIMDNPDFQYVKADLIELREGKLDKIKTRAVTESTKKIKENVNSNDGKKKVLSDVNISIIRKALKLK